jgi:hypothetical protein
MSKFFQKFFFVEGGHKKIGGSYYNKLSGGELPIPLIPTSGNLFLK